MDEIKFRYVWKHDGNGSIMITYATLDETESGNDWSSPNGYKLIGRDRYTNINDKDGKEIYERDVIDGNCFYDHFTDVVRFGEFWFEEHSFIGWYAQDSAMNVSYDSDAGKSFPVQFPLDQDRSYKIVDNVYNNPNWLDKEDK